MPVFEKTEIRTVALQVVTPVHVSGEVLPKWMWGTDSEKVYVLDVESLAESVGMDGIPRAMEEITGSNASWEHYRQFYREVNGLRPDKNLHRANDLVLFIRSGPAYKSSPYFPGSSIKGSLRTAVLGSAIASDDSAQLQLRNYIVSLVSGPGGQGKRPKPTPKTVFQQWYRQTLADSKDPAHYDPFRAVSVSDAEILDGEFVVCNTVRKKLGGQHSRSSGPKSSYEFLVRGTVRFTVRFDPGLWDRLAPDYLRNLNISTVGDLLERWASWYREVINFMKSKGYPLHGVSADRPVMVGRLSGYLSKTVALALAGIIDEKKDPEGYYAVLQLVNGKIPQHKGGRGTGQQLLRKLRRKVWPETGTYWALSYNGSHLYPGILEIL